MNFTVKFSDEGNNLKNNMGYDEEDIHKFQTRC